MSALSDWHRARYHAAAHGDQAIRIQAFTDLNWPGQLLPVEQPGKSFLSMGFTRVWASPCHLFCTTFVISSHAKL